MITNEAIALASEIVEAQKRAKIDHIAGGVFISTDSTKGKYAFSLLETILVKEKPFIQWIDVVEHLVEHQKELDNTIAQQNEVIKQLQEKIAIIKEELKELGIYLAEEGKVI